MTSSKRGVVTEASPSLTSDVVREIDKFVPVWTRSIMRSAESNKSMGARHLCTNARKT
jgi:hypothetical protein